MKRERALMRYQRRIEFLEKELTDKNETIDILNHDLETAKELNDINKKKTDLIQQEAKNIIDTYRDEIVSLKEKKEEYAKLIKIMNEERKSYKKRVDKLLKNIAKATK